MARRAAESCRNCGATLAPGAAFCTLCGAAVPNRAANETPSSVPLGSNQGSNLNLNDTAVPSSIPGIIAVGAQQNSPVLAPVHVGTNLMLTEGTELIPGGAGRRLVAKIIDGLAPAILMGLASGIGLALSMGSAKTVDGQLQLNLTWFLILTAIAGVISIAYGLWIWFTEAKKGTTPGNLVTGLRTTNMEGEPAGILSIFLRQLIIAVGSIVPTVGTILVIISNVWDSNDKKQGWHDKVAHTLVFNVKAGRNPLETGGITGRISYQPPAPTGISQISSPLAGGVSGAPLPSVPLPSAPLPGVPDQMSTPTGYAPPASSGPITSVPLTGAPVASPNWQNQQQGQESQGQQGATAAPEQQSPWNPAPQVSSFAPPVPSQPNSGQPISGQAQDFTPTPNYSPSQLSSQGENQTPGGIGRQQFQPPASGAIHNPAQLNPSLPGAEQLRQSGTGRRSAAGPSASYVDPSVAAVEDQLGETRVRSASGDAVLRLVFDDNKVEDIRQVALIGRNPAGYDGEMIESLVSVQDSSRSVSKTHLHVRVGTEGLWVTDRNSTNGSAITHVNGQREKLVGGNATLAEIGARVHFGDRSFAVGRP